ncbi:MAG TPA: DUF2079 domain-containing protein, partial [Clostridia bacterium]|nr:DUF2079 domain-containing protein [Clostridia bacterium]
VILFAVFIGLSLLTYFFKSDRLIPWTLLFFSLTLSISLVALSGENIYYNIGVSFVMVIVVFWLCKGDKLGLLRIPIQYKHCFRLGVVLFISFTAVITYYAILRYRTYSASNFDFGIFTQMFESMRRTGIPLTTVERNRLMSHFGVHFSPIYYLVLPFYAVLPRPETLLFIQAAVIGAGVFPIYAICRKLALSPKTTFAMLFIYILYPALSRGALYDFHENKFLTLLILWLIYFLVAEKTRWMFVFALLTLSVKEDAAIYVAAISFYLIFVKKQRDKGILMLVLAMAWFALAVSVVAMLGDGVMISRLEDYFIPNVAGGQGFASVIQACVFNIGYVIKQVFVQKKLEFVLWMLLPLVFLPFKTDKLATLFLMLPMFVINLMPNYPYQYDIGYQYTFGSAALLLFMMILAVTKLDSEKKYVLLTSSVVVCVIFTMSLTGGRIVTYSEKWNANKATIREVDACINKIPKDAVITSNTLFIPHLYDREEVYMFPNYHGQSTQTPYLLVYNPEFENNEKLHSFMGDDYTEVDSAGFLTVYQQKVKN